MPTNSHSFITDASRGVPGICVGLVVVRHILKFLLLLEDFLRANILLLDDLR